MSSFTIEDLPDPVMDYILSYLSPYKDLKQCMLVNKSWYKHVSDVVRKTQRDLQKAILSMSVQWHSQSTKQGSTISKRYSHSACCCGDSMYVFGGCTTANTTFNDLWRLDLATRCWIRPLATGTYPPPKACSSLVCYGENLVLFGGWTHTSPYPLQQVWQIFNHLHMYNTNTNSWTQITASTSCPAVAGHSATVHGDSMIVFGGIQKQFRVGFVLSGNIYRSCNSVWVFDFTTQNWRKQSTTSPMPLPRYGHSQIAIDQHHLLIMGGCGGPNMLLNDIWMLTMKDGISEPWEWKEMEIRQKANAPAHLSFHPACRVGNQVVVFSKTRGPQMSPSSLPHPLGRRHKVWMPPVACPSDLVGVRLNPNPVDVDPCVNGKKGVLKRQFERHQPHSSSQTLSSDEDDPHSPDFAKKLASSASTRNLSPSSTYDFFSQAGPSHAIGPSVLLIPQTSADQTKGPCDNNTVTSGDCDSGISDLPGNDRQEHRNLPPSFTVRPNSRRNRQRQLEGLDRMEQRLKDLRAGALRFAASPGSKQKVLSVPVASRNPMCLYVLDISTAIGNGFVTWRKLKNQSASAPEGIILCSLVLGRGELIMFGGIQKDLNSKFQEGETVPEVVSNALHFMSAQRYVI